MRTLELSLLNGAFVASLWPHYRRFTRALAAPARAQQERLKELVQKNANSSFGREHGFAEIHDVAAFQRRVPARDYEGFSPYVSRIAAGEQGVLTRAPVRMLERTSGSSSQNKLIPYTQALLSEFSRATGPWLFDMYVRHPALLRGSSYWSVSPVAKKAERTSGGLSVGLEDDTEYFSPLERWALTRLLSVPKSLVHMRDIEAWRFETCRFLLADASLAFVSVWSPSFLTILMEVMEQKLDDLLACLPLARAQAIRQGVAAEGRLCSRALWPNLTVVSCWADGPSQDFLPELAAYFPGVTFAPKGLLATEGVVSFPFGDEGAGTLAVTSHFLEFLDVESPSAPPVLAHELRVGACYSPLLSTGGGFYRYHLKDVLECVGHTGRVPRVRFVEKLEQSSDLCGEKLHAAVVRVALERAQAELGVKARFALVAPVREERIPSYRLYLETNASDGLVARMAEHVERTLRESHHYDYCRKLGQLGALRVKRVESGARVYERTLRERGQRAGDVKPTCLDPASDWDRKFDSAAGAECTP
jgi:hypothetical protein